MWTGYVRRGTPIGAEYTQVSLITCEHCETWLLVRLGWQQGSATGAQQASLPRASFKRPFHFRGSTCSYRDHGNADHLALHCSTRDTVSGRRHHPVTSHLPAPPPTPTPTLLQATFCEPRTSYQRIRCFGRTSCCASKVQATVRRPCQSSNIYYGEQHTQKQSQHHDPQEQLLKLLDLGSDVILTFTDAEGTIEEVPAHSQILQQWSEDLAGALSTEHSSSNSSKTRIPMDGTSKEVWLLAMEFIYPVIPPSKATWDNIEALLQVGDKYGMPALMHRVSAFLHHHKSELKLQPGKLFVWRWIEMLDRYGLTAAVKECIDCQRDVTLLVDACSPDILASLSNSTLQHLFNTIKPWLPRRSGKCYCRKCQKVTDWNPMPNDTTHSYCANYTSCKGYTVI